MFCRRARAPSSVSFGALRFISWNSWLLCAVHLSRVEAAPCRGWWSSQYPTAFPTAISAGHGRAARRAAAANPGFAQTPVRRGLRPSAGGRPRFAPRCSCPGAGSGGGVAPGPPPRALGGLGFAFTRGPGRGISDVAVAVARAEVGRLLAWQPLCQLLCHWSPVLCFLTSETVGGLSGQPQGQAA